MIATRQATNCGEPRPEEASRINNIDRKRLSAWLAGIVLATMCAPVSARDETETLQLQNHREWNVPDVGHNGDKMLTSPCGLADLFDLPGCAAQRWRPRALTRTTRMCGRESQVDSF